MPTEQSMHPHVDEQFIQILEELLETDEDITARAVARRHPTIRHASTITRNEHRARALAEFQSRQKQLRQHIGRIGKRSKDATASELTKRDELNADLKRKNEALLASHVAMIRVVGELGGMSKWVQFFEQGYRPIRDELYKMNAMPTAEIKNLGSSR